MLESTIQSPTQPWLAARRAETITAILFMRLDWQRELTFLDERGKPTVRTWGHVCQMAFQHAAHLKAKGVQPGDRVVLMLPTCIEYLYAFFGTIAAGAIPVPVYPPFNPKQLTAFLQTLVGILDDSGATTLIYWKEVKPILGHALAKAKGVRHPLAIEDFPTTPGEVPATCPVVDPNDTALIQYTSGSTGMPKGVELSHHNLIHNVHSIESNCQLDTEKDLCVSWLPLYHDMGLIGALLGALYSGIDLVLMAPTTFLMRPKLWLEAISTYKATLTVAPNFAYNLCANRISDKAAQGLDLSSLRIAMCGAEPIRQETYQAFLDRFGPIGFGANVFLPVYGLAESTVAATFSPIHEVPRMKRIDRDALEEHHQAREVPEGADASRVMVAFGLGAPFAASEVQIRDPETREAIPDGHVGVIMLRGPSIMKGYFRNPEKTKEVLAADGWLTTGDLGFQQDGYLYVTGRQKDLIIRHGRNYYPQDLEAAVEDVADIRKGCVIAFGTFDAHKQTESIVVIAETRLTDEKAIADLHVKVIAALTEVLGFPPDQAVLVPPQTLLKTSSGKLRRKPTQTAFLSRTLAPRKDGMLAMFKVVASSQLHWGKRKLAELAGAKK